MPDTCDDSMTLYGTQACHLCEQAASLLNLAVQEALLSEYVEVDISEDENLFTRYGFRIPVLRRKDGEELDWPFSPSQLLDFIESGAQSKE
ncbi:MAG: glutaredoxin family protein [Haliea sp.]|nr:glutaredoxin family protein [Haliea sp.]